MTQHSPVDIDAWMEDARAALSPRDVDRARVLADLEKRLQLPPEPAVGNGNGDRLNGLQAESATTMTRIGAAKAGMLAHWAVRALLPFAGIGAIAVVATQLHTSAPAAVLRPAQPAAATVNTEPPVVSAPVLAAESDTPAPVQSDSKNEPSPAPKKKKSQPKKCRTANGQERPCELKPSETALAAGSEPTSPPPSAASLSEELEALRQAQRALRSGQAAQALALLEAFERAANGRGEMQEERAAAATMARCALAQTELDKRGLYGEFAQRYMNSAYAARVGRSCFPKP